MTGSREKASIPTPTEVVAYRNMAISKSREEALAMIRKLDGAVTLPVIIAILSDAQKIFESEIEAEFKKLLGDGVLEACVKKDKEQENLFTKYGAGYSKQTIEDFVYKKRVAEITEKSVDTFADQIINSLDPKILEQKNESLIKLLKINVFLVTAVLTYKDMDHMQHLNTADVIKEKWVKYAGVTAANVGTKISNWLTQSQEPVVRTRDMIQTPLYLLKRATQYFELTSDSLLNLCHEAELWLDGIYWRTYDVYPEHLKTTDASGKLDIKKAADKEGQMNYLPVPRNGTDAVLYAHGSLSSYRLSFICYVSVREKILFAIQRYHELKDRPVSEPVALSATMTSKADTIASQPTSSQESKSLHEPLPEYVTSSQGLFTLKLSKDRDLTPEEKIDYVRMRMNPMSLQMDPLSPRQYLMLDETIQLICAKCEAYIKDAGWIQGKTNLDIAGMIVKMEKEATLPKNIILRSIIDQRDLLERRERTPKCSKMLAAINGKLLMFYKTLREEKLEPQVAKLM